MRNKVIALEEKTRGVLEDFLLRRGSHHYQIDRLFLWPEAHRHIADSLYDYQKKNGTVLAAFSENGALAGVVAFRQRDWDTRHFGWPTVSIDHFYLETGVAGRSAGADLISEFDWWCRQNRIQFASVKIYPDPETTFVLSQSEFDFVETELTLSKSLEDVILGATNGQIRYFQPSDLPELERIAAAAPWHSRFYADPRIPKDKADALYVEWVKNGSRRPEAKITILSLDGQPKGFIVWSVKEIDAGGRVVKIGDQELVAVDPAIRGQGYGKVLYAGTLKHMQDAGARLVKTNISLSNSAAINNQLKLDFQANYHTAIFHKFF